GGELVAIDVASDSGAAQVVFLDAFFQLLGGEVGVLQGDGGEGHKAFGIFGAQLGKPFVLDFDDLRDDIALGGIPIGVDTEGLHIGAPLIHAGETFGSRSA